jgi:CheY-like chemotaxis protein
MSAAIVPRTGRLLVIDDDQGVRRVFVRVLQRRGHDVRTAANADEGLHELRTFRPEAILLDLRMPLINGFGFLYRLRIDPDLRDVPVAVITGDRWLDKDSLVELRALGAEVWHKPLSADQVINIADDLLAKTAQLADCSPRPPDAALSA